GRNAEKLNQVAQKIKAISNGVEPLQVVGQLEDTSLPQKLIDETVAKFGRLDFLVNSAGQATPVGTLAIDNLLEEFDRVMAINVRSVVALTKLAVPHLEKTKGSVINISSGASIKPVRICWFNYNL